MPRCFWLTTRDGLTDDRVSSVASDGTAVWAGTQRGFDRIDESGIRKCLTGVNVLTVKQSLTHEIWVATTKGIFKVTDSSGVFNLSLFFASFHR